MDYDVTIVIACYNEEEVLEENVKEIERVMNQTLYSYELVLVDDCSSDKTRDLIVKIAENKSNMRYVLHEQNVGRGGTVSDGIKIAKGRIVGFLDIDLEVHARYIPSMILAINDGYDVVTGHRIYKVTLEPIGFLRHILSLGYRRLMRFFLGVPLEDTETGYKFFNRQKILPLIEKTKNKGWFWDTEVMALSYYEGLKIKEIPCLFLRSPDKKSSVKIFKDSYDYFVALCKFKRIMATTRGKRSIIYSYPLIYRFFMRLIYGSNFKARYEAIVRYIPEGASVVDVCCGDCYLYHRYLKFKNVDYLGLDINPCFVSNAVKNECKARTFDINNDPLPLAEYVIMLSSLYQFIPRQKIILDKLFASATERVIVSEPIRNLSDSKNPIVSFIAKRSANPGTGDIMKRFNEKSLLQLFNGYREELKAKFKTKGGREMVAVFDVRESRKKDEI